MPNSPSIIGESKIFQDTLEAITRAASTDRPALLLGESGTGKGLLAHRLHFLSPRWEQAFIRLDCQTLTEQMLETRLFGQIDKTDAHIPGLIEQASQGTLFLTEITSLSLRLQHRLLRTLESGQPNHGSNGPHPTRIIASSSKDIVSLAKTGAFLPELLDTLSFSTITLPPLRERGQDPILLAEAFAIKMTKELNRPYFPGFTDKAMVQLCHYAWPGNIRELKHLIERTVYAWNKKHRPITQIHFPKAHPTTSTPQPPNETNEQPTLDLHGLSLKSYIQSTEIADKK